MSVRLRRLLPPRVRRLLKRWFGYFFGSRRYVCLRSPADYFRAAPVLGYIGWLGHANLGDEAMFAAAGALFPHAALVRYPMEPRLELTLHRIMRAGAPLPNAVVLGGGTLLLDSGYLPFLEAALGAGLSISVLGSGARDPAFPADAQRLGGPAEVERWLAVLEGCDQVLVRGPETVDILNNLGFHAARQIGDLALALTTDDVPAPKALGRIGINLGAMEQIWGEQRMVNDVLLDFIRQCIARGDHVIFIPFHRGDERIADELAAQLPPGALEVWRRYGELRATLDLLESLELCIAQRLHGVVLAAIVGTPPISLTYRPKHLDFLESIDLPQQSIRTDQLSAAALAAMVTATRADRETIGRTAKAACIRWRNQQRDAARHIAMWRTSCPPKSHHRLTP